jgi:prolipoprotein diacylglyceryltransferase
MKFEMQIRRLMNVSLDQFVHTQVHVGNRRLPAFQVCGYIGLALAIALTMSLITYLDLSYLVMAAIIVAAVLTFFAQALLTKVITGDEELVYYRHFIAVMSVSAGVVWLLHGPVLPYLDATILGLGLFVACGRVGCFKAGCCHGRPSRWGVSYREEHAAAGFPAYLVGVRLFPIQLVEAVWLFAIVLIGSGLVIAHQPPGTALAFYVVTYALGRFAFEFLRSDIERPYLWNFSEAQWTSLLLVLLVAGAELRGVLPFQLWHLMALAFILSGMVGVALAERSRRALPYRLLEARHLKQVVEAMEAATAHASDSAALVKHNSHPPHVNVERTSLGLQVSASKFSDANVRAYHYALSCQGQMLGEATARTLVELIRQIKYPSGSLQLIAAHQGVFHFLIQP